MVDEVLALNTKLQSLAFPRRETLEDGEIVRIVGRQPHVRPVQRSFLSDRARRCKAVRVVVEARFPSGIRVAGEQRHQVIHRSRTQPAGCVHAARRQTIGHGEERSTRRRRRIVCVQIRKIRLEVRTALVLVPAGELPVIDRRRQKPIAMDRAGQVVDVPDVEDVGVIVVQWPVVGRNGVRPYRRPVAEAVGSITVPDAHHLAEGVVRLEVEQCSVLPPRRLERVVLLVALVG